MKTKLELETAANLIAVHLDTLQRHVPAVAEFVQVGQQREAIMAQLKQLKEADHGNADA